MDILQSLQQEPTSESGFAYAGLPHINQILVPGDKVEFSEGANLLAVDEADRSRLLTLVHDDTMQAVAPRTLTRLSEHQLQ